MSTQTDKFETSSNLINALLECFDEAQNLRLMIRGATLAIDGSDLSEVDDQFAVLEILRAAERIAESMIGRMSAANDADVKAYLEGLRKHG
jgi:hypothetical protein